MKLPKFRRIKRICGYILSDTSRWNPGKKDEERRRVKHTCEEPKKDNE